MNYYIGVDIGATKIAAGLILGDKIIKRAQQKTDAKKSKAQVLSNIVSAITEVYLPKVKGIGVGIAGAIDPQNGIVISSPNFNKSFKNVALENYLEKKFHKPVRLENDTHCFTLGETIYGQAKKYKQVIGLTLGTGVGGGIVLDKKIYHGKNGLAGELGHMTIKAGGLTCSCGQKGHLEIYASGTAMVKLYEQLTGQKKDAFFVEKKFLKKDKNAIKVWQTMSEALATGLANIINIFNPEIIILGGGLSRVNSLVNPAIELARKKVVYPKLNQTKIVISRLKSDAALLGAAALFKKF
ncbi:MAG: ROK family protein [Patescibacteria group bacterium]|jgi:glucokinase